MPMTSPMSNYSSDAKDFTHEFKKKIATDPRLEFHQDIVQDFGESYEINWCPAMISPYISAIDTDRTYVIGLQIDVGCRCSNV